MACLLGHFVRVRNNLTAAERAAVTISPLEGPKAEYIGRIGIIICHDTSDNTARIFFHDAPDDVTVFAWWSVAWLDILGASELLQQDTNFIGKIAKATKRKFPKLDVVALPQPPAAEK